MNKIEASWVRPGRGVAVAVAAAVSELQGSDRLAEVIVVVPPGGTAATLRRLLPQVSGGVAGIRFLTPIDLAVELVDSSVSTMRAVTTQLQLAAITAVLRSDECPEALLGVRDHPATIDALVDMALSLRAAHVHERALTALAGEPGSVRSALVEVVRRARQRLVELRVRDESATLAAVEDVDESVLAALRVVLVVTDTFHPAQVGFLQRVADQSQCRLVSIVPAATDSSLIRQLGELGCGEVPQSPTTTAPRVVSCPDPDEEVRQVVRWCAALIDDGVPADDIAVICAAQSYRRPVRDELQRAGIAWSGGAVEKLLGSVAGQVLRHLVDGIVGEWDRPNVFRLLSVAPMYPIGDLGAPRRVGQWTTLCRSLGLVSEADWSAATARLEAAQSARRQRWGDDPDDAPSRREAADTQGLDRLLKLVERLRNQTGRIMKAKTWAAATKALGSMLEDHIGVSTWRERAWADGPAWQRNAADHVEHLVAGLAELDLDGVAVPFTASTMRQVVGTLVDTPVRRRGDAAGAVSIADIGGAVCIDARHVFVVGVNEGVLPATAVDDLLLGRDLPEPAASVIEGPRARASRAERAWNALLASDATVTATFARTDLRRGGEVYPSPLLVGMSIERHESHADGLINGQALTTSERLARDDLALSHSSRLARRVDALRARLNPEATEFDGIVGPHPSLAPPGKVWAITAVERQAACGLGYFGQHVLGLTDETDPAAILSIEPAQRGTLVHAVFELVATEWLALAEEGRPPWLHGDHLTATHERAIEVLDQLAADIGSQHRLGHEAAWAAERVHILQSIAAALDHEASEGSRPVAGEHSFSGVEVGGVAFRGKIDRIDLMPHGALRVTDYKTGKVTASKDPLSGGQSLQLPLYARAADHDRALLTGSENGGWPPATARYLQVRDAGVKAVEVALDAALIGAFEAYVAQWLDEIAAGQFSPQPHPPNGRCLMCCVDSLGVEELAERARHFSGRANGSEESE